MPDPIPAASPVVRGARDGLELWWWVVTEARSRGVAPAALGPTGPSPSEPKPAPPALEVADLKSDLEDVLSPYLERPVPMSEPERAAWHDAGLRVFTVPVADLERLQSRLRTIGPTQRQWFGERPEWTDAVTGPTLEPPRTVRIADRARALPPGAMRLLLRCWIAPAWNPGDPSTGSGPGAVLRVEMLPEHLEAGMRSRRVITLEGPPAADRSRGEGTPFTELTARLSLRDGEACVIVPESPRVDWATRGEAAPVPVTVQGVGPPAPPIPTVGEAMLSTAAFPDAGRRVRVVLVLVPRVPENFRLTAQASSSY